MKTTRLLAVIVSLAVVAGSQSRPSAQPLSSALRIVVVEGEDAVNIIQQKTAVAPVIEVRDRNDQPVAGALVNFAIRSGRATFGGARTLSVTTNAAGRAVAAGFAPTGSGALQISATAAFQGQTAAAVTIAQTTVQTAAQAAAVGASSAGGTTGGSAGAGAGAGGGGLSGTTIGIVGAAAAAGAAVAVKELGGGSGGSLKSYTGQYTATLPMTFPSGTPCTRNEAHTGTLEIEVGDDTGGISGTAHSESTIVITPGTCSPIPAPNNGTDIAGFPKTPIGGTAANLTFNSTQSNAFPAGPGTGAGINTYAYSFAGTYNGNEITGTLTVHREIGAAAPNPNNGTGTFVVTITLR